MNLYEGLRVGWIEIISNKTRSFLSLCGIAIGITSVTAMSGIMAGFQHGIRESVANSGEGRLYVKQQTAISTKNQSQGLTLDDADAIRRNFPGLRVVSPIVVEESNVFSGSYSARVSVKGVVPQWRLLDWNYKLRGRFIDDADIQEFGKVCVLLKQRGDKAEFWRQDDPLGPIFKHGDILGKQIRIGQTAFRVVGIIEEGPRDELNGDSTDDQNVFVPITSFQKRLFHKTQEIQKIDLDTGNRSTSYSMERRVFGLLKRRHRGVEDFRVANQADDIGQMLEWADKTTLIMGAIAAIALFAGGVGIMNITLASMNARIKEIGIRKSVGARDRDIKLQFLLEASTLSFSGGVLGAGVGFGICLLIKAVAHMAYLPPLPIVAVSLVVSIGVGVLFSWYPAREAARMDPIEALRME